MKVFNKWSLKEKYYQWRYWNHLYRNMVKHLDKNPKDSKQKSIPYINKPGIILSFDDSYRINDWYRYGKELFGYYDIKVTFNINGIHPLEGGRTHTQDEVDKLLELQSNGHEIAHHGFKHHRATEYANEFGYDQWVEDEINMLLKWMEQQEHSKTKEKFKKPTSFAFPHFHFDEEHVKRIIPKYFKISRGHLNKDNLTPFNHVGSAPSICLDGYYSCNTYYLKKIIKLVKQSGKNLILTCHSILPEEEKTESYPNEEKSKRWGVWRVDPKLIQWIIKEARKNDIEFYTTSEMAGIATFIDPNLEKAVREKLSLSKDKWIKISEILKIKELDLSNRGITHLDGLEYFLNLEMLNLKNNKIADFRLLKKLPKLKSVQFEDSIWTENKQLNGNPILFKWRGSCMLLGVKLTSIIESLQILEAF